MDSIIGLPSKKFGTVPQTLLLPHAISSNLYVQELGRAYSRLGLQVVYNADNLAEVAVAADLIHLQWPEEHYRWTGQGTTEARAARFLENLDRFKSFGSRLIWTVHNLAPHDHFENPLDRRVYQEVINRADLIVHHCAKSRELLAQAYEVPSATRDLVAPHGHFMGYPRGAQREEARRRLRLRHDAFVYLHFGLVRAYKGLDTLLGAFSRAQVSDKLLIVAGRYMSASDRSKYLDRLRIAWIKRLSPRVRMFLSEIPNDEVQLFMAAADVVVLAHRAGLNSGVGILGMSFGKLVIGPDLGCVSSVLGEGRNIVYSPGNADALARAMEQARRLDLVESSRINAAAAARWDWGEMATRILDQVSAARSR